MENNIIKRINIAGIFLFFLLMIFQNLIKARFENEYLFTGYIWGILFIIFLLIYNLYKKSGIIITDLDRLIFIFIAVQVIYIVPNFINYPQGALMGFLYNTRNFFFPYFLIRLTMVSGVSRKWIIRWMFFLGFLIAAYGIFQIYFDWERLIWLSTKLGYFYGPGAKRIYSILLTPLDVAYLTMILSIFSVSYILGRGKIFSWFTRIIYLMVFLVCLYLTYTRSAYMGVLLGILSVMILYFLWLGFGWKWLLIVLAVLALIFGIFWWQFPEIINSIIRIDDSSAVVHFASNRAAIDAFLKNPFGTGFGLSGWTVVSRGTGEGTYFESSFLQMMVETGIIGIVLHIMIIIKILFISLSNYFKRGNGIFLGVFGSTLGLLAASFFLPVNYFSTTMSFYWGFVALAMHYRQDKEIEA